MPALNNLDKKLLKYISHKNGFYVEAGAYDGIDQSNTKLFEDKLNWTGLLVEPIPSYYDRCKKNRPNNIVENFALSNKSEMVEIFDAGLMTIVSDSITHNGRGLEHANAYVEKHAKNHKIKKLAVKSIKLQELFDRHEITTVDLLSLDVEGYEYKTLCGIDFSKTKIDYILLECNVKNSLDLIKKLLYNYELVDKLSKHDHLFKYIQS